MSETTVLDKIHEDLELLKQDMAVIKEVMMLDPSLKEEIIEQVGEARKRIAEGTFVKNEEVLKEFGLE